MNAKKIDGILATHAYPGRGIILGRSADNKYGVVAYFIMGRSGNSRNRVFETTDDGIRTRAFDESKMVDPSLIIYHPVRKIDAGLIVTNGDQTDTIRDFMVAGKSFADGLRTRCFEPDPPNYTPRISGVLAKDGSYVLSILKSLDGNPDCNKRFFYEYDNPQPGMGHFIHTYQANLDPLPSFEGEPRTVEIDGNAQELADMLWSHLNADNKVSLFVRTVDLKTGETETVIKNKHQ